MNGRKDESSGRVVLDVGGGVFQPDITDLVGDLREKHELWKELRGECEQGGREDRCRWQVVSGDDLVFLRRCSAALINGDSIVMWLMAQIFQADADPTQGVPHELVERLWKRVLGRDAEWRPSLGGGKEGER